MRRISLGLLTSFLLLIILGCSKGNDGTPFGVPVEKKRPFFFGITNFRMLFKDSLIASAYFDKTSYKNFDVGSPAALYNGKPRLIIKLPDTSIVDLTSPDAVDILMRKALLRSPCKERFFDRVEASLLSWPEGTEILWLLPYKFYVRNHTLLGMTVTYDPNAYDFFIGKDGTKTRVPQYRCPAPELGTTTENMKSIPLTAQDFRAAFGEPDRVVESFIK